MANTADTDREGESSYRAPRVALRMSDFELLNRLGDGSFCEVYLARRRSDGKEYALKVMDKHLIIREKKQEYVAQERHILDKCDSPLVVPLHFTFQDPTSLYMGLEVCRGGELFEQIQKKTKLDVSSAQFYAAEVVLMLEFLRTIQVVHRDIKPENLMLTSKGHLKLIDFGSAKLLKGTAAEAVPQQQASGAPGRADASEEEASVSSGSNAKDDNRGAETASQPRAQMGGKKCSLTGTADYVSPEMLNSRPPLSYPADLWALGCCLFQMLSGRPPFRAASEYLTFERIVAGKYDFPEDFPEPARSLVEGLLVPDPDKRIGAYDLGELKAHPFFEGINWEALLAQVAPDFIPPKHLSADEVASDWELQSLNDKMQQAHMGRSTKYEPNPSFATPAAAAGNEEGGATQSVPATE